MEQYDDRTRTQVVSLPDGTTHTAHVHMRALAGETQEGPLSPPVPEVMEVEHRTEDEIVYVIRSRKNFATGNIVTRIDTTGPGTVMDVCAGLLSIAHDLGHDMEDECVFKAVSEQGGAGIIEITPEQSEDGGLRIPPEQLAMLAMAANPEKLAAQLEQALRDQTNNEDEED